VQHETRPRSDDTSISLRAAQYVRMSTDYQQYPNSFDKANNRDGSLLMIHGDCSSSGCYAITDEQISEIYSLARDSFLGGRPSFQVQAYRDCTIPPNANANKTQMRFVPDGPDIPNDLIRKWREGKVLFLAGAGVSVSSRLPLFEGLTSGVRTLRRASSGVMASPQFAAHIVYHCNGPIGRWSPIPRRRGLRPFILNLCSVAFLTSPRDVVAQADTKGVIYERASCCFCRRVGF
jgi:hypothetical protein